MFEGIGKIGDYVQRKELKVEAKYRLKTGQDMKKQIQKQVADDIWRQMTTKVSKKTDEARIAGIKQKLRSGKELSASEMKYLKETDEDLYTKAKKAQEMRDELRSALKRAKTKSEARMALVQAQSKVATEAMLEAKNGSGAGMSAAAGMGGATAAAGSTGDAASVAEPGGEATGAAAMDTGVDADVAGSDASTTGTSAEGTQAMASDGAQAANGMTGEADGAAADGTTEASTEHGSAGDEREDAAGKTAENRQQTLKNLENGGGSSKMDFDTKFIYQMRALQDEWNRFSKDKSYQELPEDDFEAMQEPQKRKHAYEPKRRNDVLAASDAYDTAANLLLSKVEAEGTTTVEK